MASISKNRNLLLGIVIVLSMATMASICTVLLSNSFFNRQITKSVNFSTRQVLGRVPLIDGRLKIVMYDNDAVHLTGKQKLSLDAWSKIIRILDYQKPSKIIFDKMFTHLDETEQEKQNFTKILKSLKTPVYAGAFKTVEKIVGSPTISSHWLSKSPHPDSSIKPASEKSFVYGPEQSVIGAFRGIGHINYSENSFQPFVQVETGFGLWHLSYFANEQIGDDLDVSKMADQVDLYKHQTVNFISQERLYQRSFGMSVFLTLANRGKLKTKVSPFEPGDIILVLPAAYTGHTDWFPTPLGRTLGGFVLASEINSVLTGQPIRGMDVHWLVWFAASSSLLALIVFSRMLVGIVVFAVSSIFICAFGLTAFVLYNTELPWLSFLLPTSIACLVAILDKSIRLSIRSKIIHSQLQSKVPIAALEDVKKHGVPVQSLPQGRVVTVMFVDIVNFSQFSEKHDPDQVFKLLKERMRAMSETVRQFNGIVDRSLGDGLLAYFGYQFERDGAKSSCETQENAEENKRIAQSEMLENHADNALACAIEIQRQNVDLFLSAEKCGDSDVAPLRIGLNTSPVYLGNLGSEDHIDITIVGTGVNLAKRFEDACDPFSITMGESTRSMLFRKSPSGTKFYDRYIKVKHSNQFLKVVHCDPLVEMSAKKDQAIRYYKESNNIVRHDPRLAFDKDLEVRVYVVGNKGFGRGVAVNFSRNGMAFVYDRFLGRNSVVVLELESSHPSLSTYLQEHGLTQVSCVVKWGDALSDGRFIHGVKIVNYTELQNERLIAVLEDKNLLGEASTNHLAVSS